MSVPDRPGGRRYIPALDGLRGLAVAAVVLFHLGYLDGGFLGVDVFFVLSGYLITTLLVGEWLAEGSIDLRRFWLRRARRLLPAVFIVLAAVSIYAAFFADAIDLAPIRDDGLAGLFYFANWHQIIGGVSYFDIFRTKSPLEHLWSLSVEEQFYFLWPLLAVGVLRRRFRRGAPAPRMLRLLMVGLGLAFASVTAMLVLFHRGASVDRVYYGTDTRAGAILIGATLAVGLLYWKPVLGRTAVRLLQAAGLLMMGVVFATWAYAEGTSAWLYQGGLTASGLAVCVVIAAVAQPAGGLLSSTLALAPLRWLGRISYGLYLWHWPVIVALNPERTGLNGPVLAVTQVAVSLALAELSAYLVEQPIRRMHFNWQMAGSGTLLGAAACIVALIFSTISTTTGTSEMALSQSRTDNLVVATDPVANSVPTKGTSVPTRTLVVGDSGAFFVGAGMNRVSSEFDRTVVNRGTVGCGVARADGRLRLADGRVLTDPEGCDQYLNRWGDYLNEYRPQEVVLVLADVGGGDRFINGQWVGDCDPEFDQYLDTQLRLALLLLGSQGASVRLTTIPNIVGASDPADARQLNCRNDALRAAATDSGADVIDFQHWACPTPESCIREFKGGDMRPDRVHFVGFGADIAARWIFEQVPN